MNERLPEGFGRAGDALVRDQDPTGRGAPLGEAESAPADSTAGAGAGPVELAEGERRRTPNEQTRHKRAQRKRQRNRLQKSERERRSERNRGRADRARLADWIDEHLPDVKVDRSRSGAWSIAAREESHS